MVNMNPSLYNILTDTIIDIPIGKIKEISNSIGIDYTSYSRLKSGKSLHIDGVFILKNNINKMFTLIDVDSGKKYNCINNKTIFKHLGVEYNDNEAKYVYELKSMRQKYASICGRVFMLLGNDETKRFKKLKSSSEFILKNYTDAKIRKTVKSNIQGRILSALRGVKVKKSFKTNYIIGCSNAFLYNYLESKFTNGMNWYNRNMWAIDHIVPCSKFDLTNDTEIKKCFHYTNLQPIWKSNKVALLMGENNSYIGNINKSNNLKNCYDYKLAEDIKIKNKNINNIELAKYLFSKGIRKV